MVPICFKSLTGTLAVALACATLAGCATDDPIRARNQAELGRLEACGYSPVDNDLFYPENIWAAQRREARGECGPGHVVLNPVGGAARAEEGPPGTASPPTMPEPSGSARPQ